jgi:hypothetical protein
MSAAARKHLAHEKGEEKAFASMMAALAEGVTAASHRFERLQGIGDRVQERLPGPPERWWMLPFMRVSSPWPGVEEESVAAI